MSMFLVKIDVVYVVLSLSLLCFEIMNPVLKVAENIRGWLAGRWLQPSLFKCSEVSDVGEWFIFVQIRQCLQIILV